MTDLANRGPLGLKAHKGDTKPKGKGRVNPVSAKRAAMRRSPRGRAALDYMQAVKELPCCVCGRNGPSDAHHPICDRFGALKADDFDVIPLCKRHHQEGPFAIHTNKAAWVSRFGSDRDYIASTRAQVDEKKWRDWVDFC